MRTYTDRYIPGDRLMTCSVCGFDYRLSQMRSIPVPPKVGNTSDPFSSSTQEALTNFDRKPDGHYACPKCWEAEHPREKPPRLRKKQPLRFPD